MRSRIFYVLAGMAAVALAAVAVHADDNDDTLPKVTILPCIAGCANAVPAKALDHWSRYPISVSQQASYVEGFVQFRITIGIDGHVHDVHLLNLVGPQAFAASATSDVASWTYTPATLDGHPVEEVRLLRLEYVFNQKSVGGARTDTIVAYRKAMALIQTGQLDEAFTILQTELARPELNFYERGMLAFPMGDIALVRENYSQAREIVELPILVGVNKLPPEVRQELYRIRIKADLHLGDVGDAVNALDSLKASKDHGVTEDLEKLVADARAKYDLMPEIPLTSRIPPDSTEVRLTLYRRTFRFDVDSGKLNKLTMSCKQQAISSPITQTAQWHVPGNWSNCVLYVEGDPGTNFTVLESTG